MLSGKAGCRIRWLPVSAAVQRLIVPSVLDDSQIEIYGVEAAGHGIKAANLPRRSQVEGRRAAWKAPPC